MNSRTSPIVRVDHDSCWKNMLHAYFQEALELFFPAIAGCIDWSQPVIFLDGELQKLTADGKTGRRIVDMLVKVNCIDGDAKPLLLHWEVQGRKIDSFSQRLYTYGSRIFDRYRIPVSTLVVFTDKRTEWNPNIYVSKVPGTFLCLMYSTVKLVSYKKQRAELEASDNPFAIVILTHLAGMDAKKNTKDRLKYKIWLMRHIYNVAKKHVKNAEWVRHLINFIDFVFALEGKNALEYKQALFETEEVMKMTYIESLERSAEERGMQQGMQQGMEQGIKKIFISMIRKGLSEKTIRDVLGLSVKEFLTFKKTAEFV